MDAAEGQPPRDLPRDEDDQANDGESGDETVVGGGFFKDFEHGVHSASASKGLSCRIGTGSGSCASRSLRLIAAMTMAQRAAAPIADSSATGPPRRADTM